MSGVAQLALDAPPCQWCGDPATGTVLVEIPEGEHPARYADACPSCAVKERALVPNKRSAAAYKGWSTRRWRARQLRIS